MLLFRSASRPIFFCLYALFVGIGLMTALASCTSSTESATSSQSDVVQVNTDRSPIFLLIRGQSNALGAPESPLIATYTYNENVKYWNTRKKDWIVAELGALQTRGKEKSVGSYTFALTAAEALYEQFNRPVHFIVNAQSGSKFDIWLREENSFFDREVKLIEESGAKNVIVLSHQGESHIKESPEVFLEKVAKYEALLESQDWYSGLIVHGELFRDGSKNKQNPQINQLEFVASSEGLTSHDKLHFDSMSLAELGRRYADVVIKSGYVE